MHIPLLSNFTQEAMHVFLPKVLCQMPMRSSWYLRQQATLSLLQHLEDQGRTTQMPLNPSNFFPRFYILIDLSIKRVLTFGHLSLVSILNKVSITCSNLKNCFINIVNRVSRINYRFS